MDPTPAKIDTESQVGGEVTVLAPSRLAAALHAGIGGVVVALAIWIVLDSDGHALAVALLVAAVVVTVPFLGELFVPAAFTWRLDTHGLSARTGPRRVQVAWHDVRLARVGRVAGDPALHLDLTGGPRTVRTMRLPVGADVAALHAALATHLGPVAVDAEAPGVDAEAPGVDAEAPGQGATPAADGPPRDE